jgi:hypothetical protein
MSGEICCCSSVEHGSFIIPVAHTEKRTSCYALLLHIFMKTKPTQTPSLRQSACVYTLLSSNTSSTPQIWHSANIQLHLLGLDCCILPGRSTRPPLRRIPAPAPPPRRCRLPTRHQYVLALPAPATASFLQIQAVFDPQTNARLF